MSVQTITKENFEAQVLQSDKPVLVDFWAPWCGPCRMVSPVVDQIAEERPDRTARPSTRQWAPVPRKSCCRCWIKLRHCKGRPTGRPLLFHKNLLYYGLLGSAPHRMERQTQQTAHQIGGHLSCPTTHSYPN